MVITVVILMKQISSRFSIAVHILSYVSCMPEQCTGDDIADSVNCNPVIVRKIMGMLKKAGLVEVRAGIGGAHLTKSPEEITLLDVYRAVDVTEDNQLFGFHNPVPACPVGHAVNTELSMHLKAAQDAMEQRLNQVTIQHIIVQPQLL